MQDKANRGSRKESFGEISDRHMRQPQGTVTGNTSLKLVLKTYHPLCDNDITSTLYCSLLLKSKHVCLPYSRFPGCCIWHCGNTQSCTFFLTC